MKLSENFTLAEMVRSQVAARQGIDNTIDVDSVVHHNLRRLCGTLLQPLRDVVGPITVSSGYRSARLNELIGGSERSQHCHGLAADIVSNRYPPLEICRHIKHLGLPFDQLILEFGQWTHVSIAGGSRQPRNQVLTARRSTSGTQYIQGLA